MCTPDCPCSYFITTLARLLAKRREASVINELKPKIIFYIVCARTYAFCHYKTLFIADVATSAAYLDVRCNNACLE